MSLDKYHFVYKRKYYKFFNYYKDGFTLTEIIVALGILVFPLLTLILTFRGSGYVTEQFSNEHYTAMFLAKKVIEDINHRLNANPHYFTELIRQAEGQKLDVVDGQHPLFKLVENTVNFDFLDLSEDSPIVSGMPLYDQLKKFKIQVSSTFVPMANNLIAYRNLLEVSVKVFWKDNYDREQSYILKQRVSGYNEDLFKEASTNLPAPFLESNVAEVLWQLVPQSERSNNLSFQEFISKNGGNIDTVMAVGQILLAANFINDLIDISNLDSLQQEINNLTTSEKQRITNKEKLAEQLEIKASDILMTVIRVLPFIKHINYANITASSLGKYLLENKTKIAEALTTLALTQIHVMSLLDIAKNEYGSLLSSNFIDILPVRKIPLIATKFVDILKFQVLLSDDQTQASLFVNELNETLNTYERTFRGKFPHFIDFITKEKSICTTFDSIKTFYGKDQGLAKLISDTIDESSTLSEQAVVISKLSSTGMESDN